MPHFQNDEKEYDTLSGGLERPRTELEKHLARMQHEERLPLDGVYFDTGNPFMRPFTAEESAHIRMCLDQSSKIWRGDHS